MSTLLRSTVIQGKPSEGTLSNAVFITKHLKGKTIFLSMNDGEMSNGILYTHTLSEGTKAIIITDVFFPHHTEAIIKMFTPEKITFFKPGRKDETIVKMPALIFCTSSPKELIPFNQLPGGPEKQVGYLDCSFD